MLLQAIKEDKTQENCQKLGPYILQKLAQLRYVLPSFSAFIRGMYIYVYSIDKLGATDSSKLLEATTYKP